MIYNERMEKLTKLDDFLMYNCPPDSFKYPLRYTINTTKAGVLPLCIFFMFYFGNFSSRAFIYAGLHGSYGLIWLGKDVIFGDKYFGFPATIMSNLFVGAVASSYYMIPYLTISE